MASLVSLLYPVACLLASVGVLAGGVGLFVSGVALRRYVRRIDAVPLMDSLAVAERGRVERRAKFSLLSRLRGGLGSAARREEGVAGEPWRGLRS